MLGLFSDNKSRDGNITSNNSKRPSPKSHIKPIQYFTIAQNIRGNNNSTSPTQHSNGPKYTPDLRIKQKEQDYRRNHQCSYSPKYEDENHIMTMKDAKCFKEKDICSNFANPIDQDSFTKNIGSIIESTLEGSLLAQNIPPMKPNTAAKIPNFLAKYDEDNNILYKPKTKDNIDKSDNKENLELKESEEKRDVLSIKRNTSNMIDSIDEKIKLSKELLNHCKYGEYEGCFNLLDKKRRIKANVNFKGENDWTPLHFACLNGNIKIINLLLSNGANADAETTLKFTPLIIACQKGYDDIVNLLITSGSDINSHDIYHNTPLHYAAQYGYKKIVQALLQRPSINLNMKNNDNKTAYELAIDKEIKQIFDHFFAEKTLLNSKFMQKVPIHNIKSEHLHQMFNGFPPNDTFAKSRQHHLRDISSSNLPTSTTGPTSSMFSTPITTANTNTNINTPGTPGITGLHLIQSSNNNNNNYPNQPNLGLNFPTTTTTTTTVTTPMMAMNMHNYQNNMAISTNLSIGSYKPNINSYSPTISQEAGQLTPRKKVNQTTEKKRGLYQQGNINEMRYTPGGLNHANIDTDNSNNPVTIDEEKIGPSSFTIHSLIGKGSFGEVYLVEKKNTRTLYAMKMLHKSKIMQNNLVKYALTERNVLSLTNHPFIVKLNYAFQTHDKLFLILDYCPGGDLGDHLRNERRFTEERARIYICELILALEDLHRRDIIFRDLKPDNIVLDAEGHALLTDFGLSKEGVLDHSQGARSFCGSVAYLAPEMLQRCGHGKAVDWYLLGVVFYEMLVGIPPYYANNKEKLFDNIQNAPLKIPSYLTENAKSLLKGLLQRNPLKRLGSGKGDAEEIKEHKFFEGIDWNDVYNKKLNPPIPKKREKINTKANIDIFDTNTGGQNSDKEYITGWSFVAPDGKTNPNTASNSNST